MRLTHLLPLFLVSALANAEDSFPVRDLSIDGIYATKSADSTLYCLLGGNACLFAGVHNQWTDDSLISTWLTDHPLATATGISTRNWLMGRKSATQRRTYIWIQDNKDSLNVALVREGHYAAGQMVDMVEWDRQLAETYKNLPPEVRAQLEKERAAEPEETRPRRLVSEATYAEMMEQLSRAEKQAMQAKKGMWSDAGMKGRSVPRDAYLVRQYQEHRELFQRIEFLVHENPKLRETNRDSKTWAEARIAGLSPKKVDEYVGLLERLDANEQLSNVVGLGEVCLIVADITYGLFDNGVMKGYVLSPAEPHPLTNNLDNWSPDANGATTAYRPIGDNWYLFELHH